MNHRQRIAAVLEGQVPDRAPVVCRLDLWHAAKRFHGDPGGHLRGRDVVAVQRDLGMGRSARAARVFNTSWREPVRFEQQRDGLDLHERWHLPQGTLHRVSRYDRDDEAMGLRPHVVKFAVESPRDYELLARLAEHVQYEPCYGEYERYDAAIGDAGFPMVILGLSPAHDILMSWTGYEAGYLQLADDAGPFEAAFEAWFQARQRMWPLMAQSPAALVMHGVNFDSAVTPPSVFARYFVPYLRPFIDCMHAAGKRVAFHLDGELTGLVDLLMACDFDVADCLACAPMTRITLAKIMEKFATRVVVWGGVPSTLLEDHVSDEAFAAHLAMLRDTVPANRLIVGLADQAMPTSRYDRLVRLAAFFGCEARG
jgi:hypothetical protein